MNLRRHVALVLSLATVAAACTERTGQGADLVIRRATIYTMDTTMDSARATAEAIAITGGRIVFVGSDDEVKAHIGRRTRVLELPGRMVIPGFVDTHVHPVTGGMELGECNLNQVTTPDELRGVVQECGRTAPAAAWVRGGGFPLSLFPGGNASSAQLDSLIPDHPAILTSADGHSAWVNSRALALAGVTRDTKDPVNGKIERDAAGNPSGTLRESAQRLVSNLLPPRTAADYDAGLGRAMQLAASFGITTWHEADASEDEVAAYHRADSLGTLAVRTIVSLHVSSTAGLAQLPHLDSLRRRYGSPNVRPIAAKIYADGVIEGHTGALLAPYVDRPGYRGELNMSPAALDALVRALDSAGFKVHVHAIGDRAIRATLDALEHSPSAGHRTLRPIIAHIQLFDPADIPRFATLGVVASFQPDWAFRDGYMRDLTEPRLGPARSRWQYPIASMVKTGAIVAAGSDWSVSTMNPLEAMQVAVTRQSPVDTTEAPLFPEERVDLATILGAYTRGGALASEQDSLTGTLAVGRAADIAVISTDLFRVSPHQIARAHVVLTLMGGRETFRDSTVIR